MLSISTTSVIPTIPTLLVKRINTLHLISNNTRQSTLLSITVSELKTKSGKMNSSKVLVGKVKPTVSTTIKTALTSIDKKKSTKSSILQETGQKTSSLKPQQKKLKKAQSDLLRTNLLI
jgi:hypothetical protein